MRVQRMEVGDRVLFYVMERMVFGATASVAATFVEDPTPPAGRRRTDHRQPCRQHAPVRPFEPIPGQPHHQREEQAQRPQKDHPHDRLPPVSTPDLGVRVDPWKRNLGQARVLRPLVWGRATVKDPSL